MAGYEHIRAQFSNSDTKRVMEQKIIIFTVIFFLMACEGVWRASHKRDLIVPVKIPSELAFSSDYDPFVSAKKIEKYSKY